MSWRIGNLFKWTEPAKKERRLANAYRKVFNNSEDATLVLNDIMKNTGYYQISGSVNGGDLAYLEGKRSVGFDIISRVRMDEKGLEELEIAVREEFENEELLNQNNNEGFQ